MIKLIATDLDGTLFYPKNRILGINPKSRKFLQRFLASGGEVVLVSGRSVNIKSRVEKSLRHPVTLIGCNGGFVFDSNGIRDNTPLDHDALLDLYATFKVGYGIPVWFLFDEHIPTYLTTHNMSGFFFKSMTFVNHLNLFYSEHLITGEENFVQKLETPNYKIMLTMGLGQPAKVKASELALAVKDRFGDSMSIAVSNNAIEVAGKGISKGITLTKYCREKGIRPEEVFVCGDSGNDLTMFECFPHSFAMAHSPDHFKSQANHIINRIYDLEDYLNTPSSYENDKIKPIDFIKALENRA